MKQIIYHDKVSSNSTVKLKMIGILALFLSMIIFGGCSSRNTAENNTFPKISYKAGEEGKSGDWSMKVLDVNEASTIKSGDRSYQITAKEKFIVITLEIKNISDYTISYTSKEFMLMNYKTKAEYGINNIAFNAMAADNGNEKIYKENTNFVGVKDEVGPGIIKQTYIIFEVPKETSISDFMLVNTNNNGEPTGYNLK